MDLWQSSETGGKPADVKTSNLSPERYNHYLGQLVYIHAIVSDEFLNHVEIVEEAGTMKCISIIVFLKCEIVK